MNGILTDRNTGEKYRVVARVSGTGRYLRALPGGEFIRYNLVRVAA